MHVSEVFLWFKKKTNEKKTSIPFGVNVRQINGRYAKLAQLICNNSKMAKKIINVMEKSSLNKLVSGSECFSVFIVKKKKKKQCLKC